MPPISITVFVAGIMLDPGGSTATVSFAVGALTGPIATASYPVDVAAQLTLGEKIALSNSQQLAAVDAKAQALASPAS